ncbi:MAG: Trm112 family protein [Ilumatobacteraceae bacterium]
MALDTRLLAVLACPVDKGPLYYLGDDGGLYNPRLRRRYEVREGIPVMLPDEAIEVAAAEAEALDVRIAAGELTPTFTA